MRLILVGGLVVVLGVLARSGGFQPSASAVSQYQDIPISLTGPSASSEVPNPGAAGVEFQILNRRAAQIRSHLARHYIYRHWYPRIRTIMVKGRWGFVSTSLPNTASGRRAARQICSAVLGSHVVGRVKVGYGTRALGCS